MTGQARYAPYVASANDMAARHRTAASPGPAGNSVIGLWADEPEAVDPMIEGVLQERETRPLRANGDQFRNG